MPIPERRELLCQNCNHKYDVWSAPNDLWNKVATDWHFLCFDCFVDLYRKVEMAINKSTAHVYDFNKATRESFESEGSASDHSEYRREQDAIEAHRRAQAKGTRAGDK